MIQIIADQPNMVLIDRLAAMAQLRPTEVYVLCNMDSLIEGKDPNGNSYPGAIPRGETVYWDNIYKEWLVPEPKQCQRGTDQAFTDTLKGIVVFCEWYIQSLKPSGRQLRDFKIEKGALLDQIDDRFKLARLYGHEMLHTLPAGHGMSHYNM